MKKRLDACRRLQVVDESESERASKEVGFLRYKNSRWDSSCCSSSKNTNLTQHEENFLSLNAEQEKRSTI